MDNNFELRSAGDMQVDGNRVVGTAIVYGKLSQELAPGLVERVMPGALADFAKRPNIRALLEHDTSAVLARFPGTLKLSENSRGLSYDFDLPDTTAGRDARTMLQRGDITGASYRFTVPKGGDSFSKMPDGKVCRDISKMSISEITLTSDPCYLDTTASLRSMAADWLGEEQKRLLEAGQEAVAYLELQRKRLLVAMW